MQVRRGLVEIIVRLVSFIATSSWANRRADPTGVTTQDRSRQRALVVPDKAERVLITIALTVLFHKSDNLAAAYGIAVSLTMLMTSCLLFVAMREIWDWNVWLSLAAAGFFIIIDTGFFAANSLKIAEGGYVPLLLAACIYGLMLIWHHGSTLVAHRLEQAPVSVS